MQALSVEQYDRLRHLGRCYWQRHATTIKRSPLRNPRLSVDALCFQPLSISPPFEGKQEQNEPLLVGALVTPVSLSLAILPSAGEVWPGDGKRRVFELPDGRYPFHAERVDDTQWLWRCPLIEDLRDLESQQEANRLAQRLLDRVMTPTSGDSGP